MSTRPAAPRFDGPARSTLPGPALRALEELGGQRALTPDQTRQLRALLEHQASDATAPTAVRDPTQAVSRHLADSLAALDLAELPARGRCVDIGSGAGYPGLPLAIALSGLHVTLLESVGRKCRFLQEAIRAANVTNAAVLCARAEEAPGAGAIGFDLATARALGPAPVVAEYAAPMLRTGGLLVDWRGFLAPGEDSAALAAAAVLGLRRIAVRHSEPLPGADEHYLYVYVKVRDTPERFPRRPGIARKRPLPD